VGDYQASRIKAERREEGKTEGDVGGRKESSRKETIQGLRVRM